MKLHELFEGEFRNADGRMSPLTSQGEKSWRDEKDFFKKWFSLPYLTGGYADQKVSKKKKLKEYKIIPWSKNETVKIYVNPSPGDLDRLLDNNPDGLRGAMVDGTIYIVPAYFMTHDDLYFELLGRKETDEEGMSRFWIESPNLRSHNNRDEIYNFYARSDAVYQHPLIKKYYQERLVETKNKKGN